MNSRGEFFLCVPTGTRTLGNNDALDRNRTCTAPFGGAHCVHSTTRAMLDRARSAPLRRKFRLRGNSRVSPAKPRENHVSINLHFSDYKNKTHTTPRCYMGEERVAALLASASRWIEAIPSDVSERTPGWVEKRNIRTPHAWRAPSYEVVRCAFSTEVSSSSSGLPTSTSRLVGVLLELPASPERLPHILWQDAHDTSRTRHRTTASLQLRDTKTSRCLLGCFLASRGMSGVLFNSRAHHE